MAGLPNSSNALQQWHHLFEAEGAKRSPQAQQHLQQLLRTGLPTRKHENWKYTPLDGLTNSQFVSIAGEISPQQRDALALTLDAVRLVFVDGRYVSALSDATEGSGYEVSINDDRQGLPDAFSDILPSWAQRLPLAEQGLAWLMPTVVMVVLAIIWDRAAGRQVTSSAH